MPLINLAIPKVVIGPWFSEDLEDEVSTLGRV